MTKKYQLILILLVIVFVFVHPHISLAQERLKEIPIETTEDVVNILKGIVKFVLQIIGIMSVMVILYSAVLFMTAGDNQERRKSAGEWLKWGIIGIIVAILATAIINIVGSFLSLGGEPVAPIIEGGEPVAPTIGSEGPAFKEFDVTGGGF